MRCLIPRPSTEGSGYTINERVIRSRAPTIPCEWRALSMRKGLKGGEGAGALQKRLQHACSRVELLQI